MRDKAMINAERNRRRQLLILIALLGFVGWYVFLPSQLLFALLFGGDYRAPTLGVQPTGTLSVCPRETHNCVSTAEDPMGGSNEYYGAHWIYRDGSTVEEAVSELVDVINTTRPSNFMPKVTQRRNDYVRAEYTSRFFGFVDDLEVYFPAASRPRTVDYRSASRVGDRYASTVAQDEHKSHHDLGKPVAMWRLGEGGSTLMRRHLCVSESICTTSPANDFVACRDASRTIRCMPQGHSDIEECL